MIRLYRVYDFDRKDDQGNLRDLHLEKSIDALTIGEPANSCPVTTKVDDLKSTLLVASDFFAVYKWEISGKADFEKTADYSGSLSTVVGDEKLTSREDRIGPFFMYVQCDEETLLKVDKVSKTEAQTFDVFDQLISRFKFRV